MCGLTRYRKASSLVHVDMHLIAPFQKWRWRRVGYTRETLSILWYRFKSLKERVSSVTQSSKDLFI